MKKNKQTGTSAAGTLKIGDVVEFSNRYNAGLYHNSLFPKRYVVSSLVPYSESMSLSLGIKATIEKRKRKSNITMVRFLDQPKFSTSYPDFVLVKVSAPTDKQIKDAVHTIISSKSKPSEKLKAFKLLHENKNVNSLGDVYNATYRKVIDSIPEKIVKQLTKKLAV